jgi:hypothetical protein
MARNRVKYMNRDCDDAIEKDGSPNESAVAENESVTRAAKSERASRRTVHTNLMRVKVPKTLRNALDTLMGVAAFNGLGAIIVLV